MKTEFNHNDGYYLNISDTQIYYEIIGDKSEPILVMLHGGFGNIEDLNPISKYLSKHFNIIGIDSTGHGKSTLGNKDLTYKKLQDDISEVLNHLEIKNFSILGFSDGAVIALRLACDKNFNIDKLIAIGTSWCINDVIESEEMLKSIDINSAKEIFADSYNFYQANNPKANFELFVEQIINMWLDKSSNGQPNENVSKIKTQTLLIRGDNDFLSSLESYIQLQKNIENSSILNIPFCEHIVFDEQPEIIEIALKEFLLK